MNGIKYRSADEMKDSGIEWLGEIPINWNLFRIKKLLESSQNGIWGDEERGDVNDIACVRVANFDRNRAAIIVDNLTIRNLPRNLHSKYLLNSGDLLIEKSGGGENQPVGFVCIYNDSQVAIYANFMARLRFKRHAINPIFINYFFRFLYAKRVNAKYINQTTGIQNISAPEYFDEKLSIPLLLEQRKIANFLDVKTAQFDSIIAKKEQLIAKLEEAKISLISEVVTGKVKIVDGQLVPRPPEEMKDSGVEWLGMIPKDWIVGGLTKYIGPIIDYRGKTPEKVDDGVFLVTAKNIKGGKIDYTLSEEYVRSDQYKLIMQRGAPIIGDVLFTTEAPLGEVANIDRTDIALAQRIIKFRGIECLLDNYFLRYFIMGECFQNQIQSRATGSTALGIKASKLPELKILIPTIVEQNEICRFLNKKIEYISNCIEKYIQQVTLLKSAKQSLISEAVTGKIDLRDWEIIEQGGAS